MTPEIILLITIAAGMAYIARLMERLSRAVELIEYLLDKASSIDDYGWMDDAKLFALDDAIEENKNE